MPPHPSLELLGTRKLRTKAGNRDEREIFSEVGKQTEMLAGFSVAVAEHGTAAATRDIRGFALTFYTDDGNCDFLGDFSLVFLHRDPLKILGSQPGGEARPANHMKIPRNN